MRLKGMANRKFSMSVELNSETLLLVRQCC